MDQVAMVSGIPLLDTEPIEPRPKKKSKKKKVADYYRHHQKLPKTYDGFVIELIASDRPLARDFKLFKQFGSVYYDHSRKGGYSYCILVNFSKRRALEKFVKNMIQPKAPAAKVVTYRKGKRKG